jgi:hypothetical protein
MWTAFRRTVNYEETEGELCTMPQWAAELSRKRQRLLVGDAFCCCQDFEGEAASRRVGAHSWAGRASCLG